MTSLWLVGSGLLALGPELGRFHAFIGETTTAQRAQRIHNVRNSLSPSVACSPPPISRLRG